mgnify:CR=1 FL=1
MRRLIPLSINLITRMIKTTSLVLMIGVVGPSGCGKSTLLRCINLLERPTEGSVVIDGTAMETLSPAALRERRREITMIFQQFNLLMQRSCLKNICFPMELAGVKKADAEKRAKELLEMVGLPDKANAYPAQLSGGQKQRIAIARVFLKNPSILILDEATSALDNESEILVGQSLEKLAHGRTTLTIAHRLTTIKDYDRILVLGEEGIVESGTHEQLLAKQGVYYRLWNQLPGEDTL